MPLTRDQMDLLYKDWFFDKKDFAGSFYDKEIWLESSRHLSHGNHKVYNKVHGMQQKIKLKST